jgi:hypothetical protein
VASIVRIIYLFPPFFEILIDPDFRNP